MCLIQVPGPSSSSSAGASISTRAIGGGKEQFRSHSLPLGAQLNADWTVSTPTGAPSPAPPTPTPAHSPIAVPPHDVTGNKHVGRVSIGLFPLYLQTTLKACKARKRLELQSNWIRCRRSQLE